MNTDDNEAAILRVLVVDDQPFQRRLIAETLRAAGRVHVEHVETAEACISALGYYQPNILIVDWDVDGGQGLALVKDVRAGAAGESLRMLPVIMVTARNRQSEVERARLAGIDEFVQRPFSTATMVRRVWEVRDRRRDFIESAHYTGPCRRRRVRTDAYDGPRRRLFDAADAAADAPEVQIRKGLARMYCERLGAMMTELAPDNVEGARDLALACGQLGALASDMKDRLLMSATSSLFNYVKGVGADAAVNRDVMQAHLDAIVQLAELPNHQVELRQTVTQQLTIMVTKKLRAAGQAA